MALEGRPSAIDSWGKTADAIASPLLMNFGEHLQFEIPTAQIENRARSHPLRRLHHHDGIASKRGQPDPPDLRQLRDLFEGIDAEVAVPTVFGSSLWSTTASNTTANHHRRLLANSGDELPIGKTPDATGAAPRLLLTLELNYCYTRGGSLIQSQCLLLPERRGEGPISRDLEQ